MPFGLTNAPAVFQNLINDVLQDMIRRFVFVYIDDILIFSPDRKQHVGHVRRVLRWLLEGVAAAAREPVIELFGLL